MCPICRVDHSTGAKTKACEGCGVLYCEKISENLCLRCSICFTGNGDDEAGRFISKLRTAWHEHLKRKSDENH